MSEKLINAIVEMKEKEALDIVKSMLDSGENPIKILEMTKKAVDIIGQKYEKGEYFLPQLMLTGEMMKQISELTKEKIAEEDDSEGQVLGKVLIGTVKGDIHDIGKNIVTFMLESNGFKVKDLGVDVPPEKFVDAIKEFKPDVVGMSALLTLAFDAMKNTIKTIEDAGLRKDVKIIIGGAPIDEQVVKYTGADDFGRDAVEAVSIVKKWKGVN